MRPTNRHFITALFIIFLALSVTSCGSGGGGGGSSIPVQPVTPTDPQNQVQYEVVPLLAGKGQVTSLVTYSNNLYWSDEYYGNGIWKYSVSDNTAPVLIVPRLHTPEIIVVHGNYFYWVDTFADTGIVGKKLLYKTTLDGSQTTQLRQGNILQSTTNQILVDDTAVYWANGSGYYSAVQIEKVPLDGSSPQTIYTASGVVRAISMDDTYIYWVEQQAVSTYTLFRIAKTGGTSETLRQGLIDWGCVGLDSSINMTIYNNYVYLGLSGQVVKIPTAGGTPSVMAQNTQICPMGITIYDSNLYWLNYSTSALPAYGGQVGILSVPADTMGSFSVVVSNLGSSRCLHVSSDGLSWAEADQNYTYKLKRLSWGAQSSDTLASGIYFASSDLAGNQLYYTEILSYAHFSQIGKISLTTGNRENLLGGLTNASAALVPTDNYLVFGDGYALKKVPIAGGRVDTLLVGNNVNNMTFDHLYQKDGLIYFSFGGIYSIPLDGGSPALLAKDIASSNIVSIQDGYVYYVCYPAGAWGGALAELHRVPITGATPEVVYKMQAGRYDGLFVDIKTVYQKEWIWNDQYKLLMTDIPSGNEVQLYSGSFRFLGVNTNAVFIDDWNGNVNRIPTDGGDIHNVLRVPYPVTLDRYWINAGSEDFYFSVSYLDETQGYFSEIDLLKRIR